MRRTKPVHFDVHELEKRTRASIADATERQRASNKSRGSDDRQTDCHVLMSEIVVAYAVASARAANAEFTTREIAVSLGSALASVLMSFRSTFDPDEENGATLFAALDRAMEAMATGSEADGDGASVDIPGTVGGNA